DGVGWDGVAVEELHASEGARRIVARDDVQVDVAILVHQERVVEAVGLEAGAQGIANAAEGGPQVGQLGWGEVADVLVVAPEDEEALAERVLVAIDGEPPVHALPDLVAWQGVAEKAVHGEPLQFPISASARDTRYFG